MLGSGGARCHLAALEVEAQGDRVVSGQGQSLADTYQRSRSYSPHKGGCQGRSRRAPEGDLQ